MNKRKGLMRLRYRNYLRVSTLEAEQWKHQSPSANTVCHSLLCGLSEVGMAILAASAKKDVLANHTESYVVPTLVSGVNFPTEYLPVTL